MRELCPAIALDVQPSARMQAAALAVLGAMVLACLLLPRPDLPWKLLAAGTTLALAWRPVERLVFGRGPGAVRRIEWSPVAGSSGRSAGQWVIVDGSGVRRRPVALSPGSMVLGPWMLLVWSGDGRRRFRAVVDMACTDPRACRMLKGRLRLSGRTTYGATDDNC